jgi:hypothetical protein
MGLFNKFKLPTDDTNASKKAAAILAAGVLGAGAGAGTASANDVPTLDDTSKELSHEYVEKVRPSLPEQIRKATGKEIDLSTPPSELQPPDGYQLDLQGTDTFVPAGGRSAQEALNTADPRDVDAIIQEETTLGIIEHGAEAPNDFIPNDAENTEKADKIPSLENISPKKIHPEASVTEISSELATNELPTSPEEIEQKIITILHELTTLLEKLPNASTQQYTNALLGLAVRTLAKNNQENDSHLNNFNSNL